MILNAVSDINAEKATYIGDGKYRMDKTEKPDLTAHSRDNQTLSVECFFTETADLQEILKQYVMEQRRARDERTD